jgi:cysteine-rich repeat protein
MRPSIARPPFRLPVRVAHACGVAALALAASVAVLGTPDRAHAQTAIMGGNIINQTWTAAGSPYTIQGDIVVPAGAFLRIQAGVEVRFAASDALMTGANTSRVELTVHGEFTVDGTATEPVRFRGVTTTGGSWYGIQIASGATPVSIRHATIEHAIDGLRLAATGGASVESVTASSCSSTGIRVLAGSPTLRGVAVTASPMGIRVESGGSASIEGCLVTANTSYGIYVAQTSGSADSTVSYCTIDQNGSYGIYHDSGSSARTLTVRNSIVSNHGVNGILRANLGTVAVSHTNVWQGGSSGTTTGPGMLSANPLYVSAGNRRLTSNSPCRFASDTGTDIGALPYVSDPTPGLYGTLWTNTTLPAGSHSAAGDLTVAPGVTLTLQPGATLSFATNDVMVSGANTSRAELRVAGTLVAAGTSMSPVTLTSVGTAAGSWYGVEFLSTATGSRLEQAVVERGIDCVRHASTAAQTVTDVTVRNCSSTGIRVLAGSPTLRGVAVTASPMGIRVESGGSASIEGCLVTANTSYGIYVAQTSGSADSTVSYCTIDQNGSYGIYHDSGSSARTLTVRNSIVSNHGVNGILRANLGTVAVSHTNVWQGGSSGTTTGPGMLSANPLYVSAGNRRLTSNSPCRFASDTGTDIGALPYVSDPTPGLYGTLWTNTTLPAGSHSAAGDLTVAPGVTLTLQPGATLSFATNDVMVSGANTSRAELRVAGTLVAAGTSMSPVTLTSVGTAAGSWYGVEFLSTATGSRLEQAVVERGIDCVRHASTAAQTVTDVTVRNCSSTGIRVLAGSPTLQAVRGSGSPMGIRIESGGSAVIENCLLTNNTGYGIYIGQNSGSTDSTIVHCTLDQNGSYGIYHDSGSSARTLTVRNSIVTNHGVNGILRANLGTVSVSHSNVWTGSMSGVTSVGGNLSTNPLYVSATDRHLQAGSFCIDAGTSAGASSRDLDGRTRPLDGDGIGGAQHDMGAYEYFSMPICGDGLVQPGETCDDGAANGMYGRCRADCSGLGPRCGDGVVNGPEECDDGNASNTDSCTNTCRNARCGDGFVQAGEACDDGNTSNTDGCTNACMLPRCGDGFVQAGEACDDGNTSNTDGCTNACMLPRCGDGFVQAGEECDDGNTSNTDTCTNACRNARCGDGFVQPGEACDDGNAINDDGCSNACRMAGCGDGIVQAGESCDDGNTINDDGCTNACTLPRCGDGIVQMGEECDDGNASNVDFCTSACRSARCGDGFVQPGEACDDGNAIDTDGCTNACRTATCGDGIMQAGEECDDGNASNTDGCTNACQRARCGDGIVQMGEECDDGNALDTDACLSTCARARCGDGFVWAGVESCDDGNTTDGDGCSSMCAPMTCGDGIVQAGEACDDGNASNTDGCLNSCQLASCGDGFRWVGSEACDDGNADDTDACLSTCRVASCGDGFVRAGVEECDDGNGDDGDGCDAACRLESARPDGGVFVDAGGGDAGAEDAGVADAALDADAAVDLGAGGPGGRDDGGCGCRVAGAGADDRAAPGRAALGAAVWAASALGLVGVRLAWRRRRRGGRRAPRPVRTDRC